MKSYYLHVFDLRELIPRTPPQSRTIARGVLGAYGLWFLAKILYGLWFWEKNFMVYGFSEVPKILWFMVFNC